MRIINNIAFFGFSHTKKGEPLYQEVYSAAKLLAENGYTIVNGGGPGVMNAATQGAEEVGGDTVAITFYPQAAVNFEGKYPQNVPDKEIKTGDYIERMFGLFKEAELFVIFKGGTGTLSEFATAWCLARLYYGVHKPFLLYGEFWKEIVEVIKKNMFLRNDDFKVFEYVNSSQEILKHVEKFEKEFETRMLQSDIPAKEQPFTEGSLGYHGPDFKKDIDNLSHKKEGEK